MIHCKFMHHTFHLFCADVLGVGLTSATYTGLCYLCAFCWALLVCSGELLSIVTLCTHIYFFQSWKTGGHFGCLRMARASKWKEKKSILVAVLSSHAFLLSLHHIRFFCQCFISISGLFSSRMECVEDKYFIAWLGGLVVQISLWNCEYDVLRATVSPEQLSCSERTRVITCNVMQCCSKVNVC